MFADATDLQIQPYYSPYYLQYGETNGSIPPSKYNMIAYRHDKGANCCFWDGHCEWRSSDDLVVPNPTNAGGYVATMYAEPTFRQWDVTGRYTQ